MRRESPDHTLQATALVNEAYIRLANQPFGQWNSRGHFYCAVARAMQRILVDHARRNKAMKRGGDKLEVALDDFLAYSLNGIDLLALNEALDALTIGR